MLFFFLFYCDCLANEMALSLVLFVSALCLCASASPVNVSIAAHKRAIDFSYDPESEKGPDHWASLSTNSQCAFGQQSPINIVTKEVLRSNLPIVD